MVDSPVPGGLLAAADAAARRARASGALEPIGTEESRIEDGGVRFSVRRVARDPRAAPAPGAPRRDPFADPEPDLRVAPLFDTHWCLLNKTPVLERHLLLVTRRFAPQQAWLDAADWEALAACLGEIDGLGFYNGGPEAGASQPHKHLQLVPLPLVRDGSGATLPIEPWLDRAPAGSGPVALPGPPFAHAFARLAPGAWRERSSLVPALAALADAVLAAVGVRPLAGPGGGRRQSAPYNLLVTRDWLLAVPRVCGEAHDVGVNALGFAGSLIVSDAAGLERVRRVGPLALLRAVAAPRP